MLNRLAEAPRSGIIYGLFTDKVVYEAVDEERLHLFASDVKLLELHVFDDDTEYRYVKSGDSGIECVISDATMAGKYDDTYKEKIYLCIDDPDKSDDFKEAEKISVVNYISFDDNDMIVMAGYRYSTRIGD